MQLSDNDTPLPELRMILFNDECVRLRVAPCLHDLFVLNEVPYNLRTPKLEQPIRRTTNYGLRTFSYLGSKLWNEFLSDFNYTCDTDISELRNFLKLWEGPSLDPSYRNYVWTFVGWSIFLFAVVDILGWYFWYFYFYHFDHISRDFVFHHESFMYKMTLHCIFLHFLKVVY